MDDLKQRKKLHSVEKNLIQYFVDLCKKHNFSYTILGGTLLGAVRHKGFIPWDDDVDFGMPREDYEKFVNLLLEDKNTEFPFLNFRNSNIRTYFSRIENHKAIIIDKSAEVKSKRYAWVDIFPLDGMPNDKIPRLLHQFRLLYLRMLLQYSQFSKIVNINLTERPMIEKILIKIGKIINPERFLDKNKLTIRLDEELKKYSYKDSKMIVNFMGAYKFREMFPKKMYEQLREYQFEDLRLLGPTDSSTYLRSLYGKGYMLPPSDVIKNKHFTEVKIQK